MADANQKPLIINTNGLQEELVPLVTSAGSADGGKIAKLDPATGKWNISLMPNGIGAETIQAEAGESLAAGDLVNIYDDIGKKCRKADANNTSKVAHGYVDTNYTAGQTATIYREGLNSNAVVGGTGTFGDYVFVSDTTAGQYTFDAPVGNKFAQIVGIYSDANEVSTNIDQPVIRKP